MDIEKLLLDLEGQFWLGDAEFYQRHLTDDSLMVFAEPIGAMIKADTIQTSAVGPRWAQVRFEEVRVLKLSEVAASVTYKVSAGRNGKDPGYMALASSAYVKEGESWKLAFHQQMPGGEV